LLKDETTTGQFTDFVSVVEPRLRRALSAAFGSELGREATAEALAYGWQHWDRIGGMENPAGYLFRVGQGKARRMRSRPSAIDQVSTGSADPWVEPGLAPALGMLTEKQRVVVSLIHAFDWSMSEVAAVLGVSKATVQSYEKRAMKKLQQELGAEQ
jgi:RNA polymerase sigma-70 factor (ECF subfamily)